MYVVQNLFIERLGRFRIPNAPAIAHINVSETDSGNCEPKLTLERGKLCPFRRECLFRDTWYLSNQLSVWLLASNMIFEVKQTHRGVVSQDENS